MTNDEMLQAGIIAAKAGDRSQATRLFATLVQNDPQSEQGWLWLGYCLTLTEKKVFCFRRVLSINPNQPNALRELAKLTASETIAKEPANINQTLAPNAPKPISAVPPTTQPPSVPNPTAKPVIQKTYSGKQAKSKKKKNTRLAWFGGVFALLLLVCGTTTAYLLVSGKAAMVLWPPTPTASATLTPLPTATFTPTPTSTPAPSPTPLSKPVFVEETCPFSIPSGANVTCGYVSVVEDREKNRLHQIRLAVAIYHSSSGLKNDKAPVIFLHGGPGDGAVEWSERVYSIVVEPITHEHDFIVFDQRGAGLSQPSLQCSEVNDTYFRDITGELSRDKRIEQYTKALLDCHKRLELEGTDPAAYTTLASAADVRDILVALNYPQANLYGVSYGTRLAQMVMREHPEVVRSVVLDSTVPLEVKLFNQKSAISDYAFQTLFQNCASDPACQNAYPDLQTDFTELVQRLNTEPAKIEIKLPVTGQTAMTISGLTLSNYLLWALREPNLIPYIPQRLTRISEGDYTFLHQAAALPISSAESMNIGVYLSINCHDQVYATTPQELVGDLTKYPNTETIGLASIYGSGDALFEICDLWQAKAMTTNENAPVISDIPTLILSGTYDPTTPPIWGEQVASHLSRAYLFEFPNASHGPSISYDPCPMKVITEFFQNPSIEPDRACWQETPPIHFVVSYTGEIPLKLIQYNDPKTGLTGLVPANWKAIGSGFYTPLTGNQTMIGQQVDPSSIPNWIEWLEKKFNGEIGFDKAPVKKGSRKANGMTWTLYYTTCQDFPVDIAFATSDSQTILVIMQSILEEHDAMYRTVFLPLVDAAKLAR